MTKISKVLNWKTFQYLRVNVPRKKSNSAYAVDVIISERKVHFTKSLRRKKGTTEENPFYLIHKYVHKCLNFLLDF